MATAQLKRERTSGCEDCSLNSPVAKRARLFERLNNSTAPPTRLPLNHASSLNDFELEQCYNIFAAAVKALDSTHRPTPNMMENFLSNVFTGWNTDNTASAPLPVSLLPGGKPSEFRIRNQDWIGILPAGTAGQCIRVMRSKFAFTWSTILSHLWPRDCAWTADFCGIGRCYVYYELELVTNPIRLEFTVVKGVKPSTTKKVLGDDEALKVNWLSQMGCASNRRQLLVDMARQINNAYERENAARAILYARMWLKKRAEGWPMRQGDGEWHYATMDILFRMLPELAAHYKKQSLQVFA